MSFHIFTKFGKVFAVAAMFSHLDAFDAQTKHRSERGHAMIGISLHHGRSKAARGYGRYLQSIRQFTSFSPNTRDFIDQRLKTVRLVSA